MLCKDHGQPWTTKNLEPDISVYQIKVVTHNNKIDRMNGEIRDREKTTRGLKRQDTKILAGYQIFHYYIKEHEELD